MNCLLIQFLIYNEQISGKNVIEAFKVAGMKREASLFATLDLKTLEHINFILM